MIEIWLTAADLDNFLKKLILQSWHLRLKYFHLISLVTPTAPEKQKQISTPNQVKIFHLISLVTPTAPKKQKQVSTPNQAMQLFFGYIRSHNFVGMFTAHILIKSERYKMWEKLQKMKNSTCTIELTSYTNISKKRWNEGQNTL